jgi:acyl dehydratase
MPCRTLSSAPAILPLYAKAALPAVPGVARLPFVRRVCRELPEGRLLLRDVAVRPRHLGRYLGVCGFPASKTLPPTYLHVLAFPLQLAVLTDRHFPYPAVGLVHAADRITVKRPLDAAERFDITVYVDRLRPHPRGTAFDLVTEASVAGEPVWEELSTLLRRGGNRDSTRHDGVDEADIAEAAGTARWRLPSDLGRRYAAASGDRNPLHLSGLTARAFGYPRPIAHGMWTLARCLAALDHELPAAYTVDASFTRPVPLPSTVRFEYERRTEGLSFRVLDEQTGRRQLTGWLG